MVLYEDHEDAREWVASVRANSGTATGRLADFQDIILPDKAALDNLLDQQGEPPELLIVDLKIGGDHNAGFEAIERFRKTCAADTVPIVVFSVVDTTDVVARAYELGATSFVKKPANENRKVDALTEIFVYWLEHDKRLA